MAVARRLDRQWRQITGNTGKQRDLGIRDGAAARRPFAAKRKVVERKRLQNLAEYRTNSNWGALTYGISSVGRKEGWPWI